MRFPRSTKSQSSLMTALKYPGLVGRELRVCLVRGHGFLRRRGAGKLPGASHFPWVQSGFKACNGNVIVIQDADLEYDPSDWEKMYDLIASRKVADVVYGSRFYGMPHRSLYYHHYFANRLISQLFNILFNQTLTDIETCYKMFTRDVLNSLAITCNDFGFEVQISAQIALARRWRIMSLVFTTLAGLTVKEKSQLARWV
jgi:Glycosyl transferase family 2